MYENLPDEELVSLSKASDIAAEEALISRYTSSVRSIARPYFLAGADSEDLIQEGMIGLMTAIREYAEEKGVPFRVFAFSCIRNKIYSAITNAQRGKHSPLNNYVSLEAAFLEPSLLEDPEASVIGKEASREFSRQLEGILSKFELRILLLYLEGLSYSEISSETGKSQKSVDNAVQRIRRKVLRHTNGDIR